ncbi:MAG: hypothetical protein IKO30_06650 [Lachnospiraceae bacterium]|nr:hypothetical protein [Lachnospiraceae bacterium]
MKGLKKKLFMACSALMMLFGVHSGVFAESFLQGDNTGIVVQPFVQNGDTEENKWGWMDYFPDPELGINYYFGVPGHYVIDIPAGTFDNARDPIKNIGLMIYYGNTPKGGKANIVMSIENLTYHFDGYDSVLIPSFTTEAFSQVDTMGGRQYFETFFPEGIAGEMIKHLTSIEYDAAIFSMSVLTLTETSLTFMLWRPSRRLNP